MKRSFLILFSIAFISSFLPAAVVSGEAQSKVDVCHITGEADFGLGTFPVGIVISIALPAYDAHIAHGDPVSFGLLILPNGKEGCSIDSDFDGVPDALDQCPGQGDLGYGLDPNGCPIQPPDLSVDSFCVPELAFPRIVITNSGGPMPDPTSYTATFEDGTIVSGEFLLGEGETVNLDFSNLHGWLGIFSVADYPQLSATIENCLDPVIQQAFTQTFIEILDELVDQTTPIANAEGYSLYYQSASFSDLIATSISIPGGFATTVVMSDLIITFFADCTTFTCELLGGDSTGSITVGTLMMEGDWEVVETPEGLVIAVYYTSSTITNLDLEMDDAWLNFLISIIENMVIDSIAADLEAEFSIFMPEILVEYIQPLLVE